MPFIFFVMQKEERADVDNMLMRTLQSSDHFAKHMPGPYFISQPHCVFDLRVSHIADGYGLDHATFSCLRFLINNDNEKYAAAEIRRNEGEWFLARLSDGRFAKATADALTRVSIELDVTENPYLVHALRCSAISMMAILLIAEGRP